MKKNGSPKAKILNAGIAPWELGPKNKGIKYEMTNKAVANISEVKVRIFSQEESCFL